MGFLKSRIVVPVVTKIRAGIAACKKIFRKKTSKAHEDSGTKSKVSSSSSVVLPAEREQFQLPTPTPTRLDTNCTYDTIQPELEEVITQQPSVHEELVTVVTEILPSPSPDNQIVAISHRNVKPDDSEVPVQSPVDVPAINNENLPTPDDPTVAIDHIVLNRLDHPPNPWIVDVSWETCNPTSGAIYHQVMAKATYHAASSQYVIVGPYNPASAPYEFELLELPLDHPLAITRSIMHSAGFQVLVGRWLIPGSPLAILLDVVEGQRLLDLCLNVLDDSFPTKINVDDNMAIGAIVFGFMTGTLLNILNMVLGQQAAASNTVPVPVIAHFHEWTAGTGILFMKLLKIAKGVATVYTEHESPFDSFYRTICVIDWIKHRDHINSFAQGAVDRYIEHLPDYGDDICSMYETAIRSCQEKQLTVYFDIASTINYYSARAIQESAINQDFIGKHFVLTSMNNETLAVHMIEESEFPNGSPLDVAVQMFRLHGYKVVIGKFHIPGQPYVLLFDVVDAREDVFKRVSKQLRHSNEESVSELYNDENVFRYLVSLFFSSLNNQMARQEAQTGERVPKVIRIYDQSTNV